MQAQLEEFANSIKNSSREELQSLCLELYEKALGLQTDLASLRSADTQMAQDYQALKNRLRNTEAELEETRKVKDQICEQLELLTRSKFGSNSETMSSMSDAEPAEDPLSEEAVPEENSPAQEEKQGEKTGKRTPSKGSKARKALIDKLIGNERKTKQPGKTDYSNLPHTHTYELDIDKLNEKYGEKGWEIAAWHEKEIIQRPICPCYVEVLHTPVVKPIGHDSEQKLVAIPRSNDFYKGSHISPSMVVYFLNEKYFKGVPYYTVCEDLANSNLFLSRQTITNISEHFALECFAKVYDYLAEEMDARKYTQSDETYLQVLHEPGKAATSKKYLWCHTTGELDEGCPIIIFSYDPSRGADHLRCFYADFSGTLTSDAYGAYRAFVDDTGGRVVLSYCNIHARRKFVEACKVLKTDLTTPEELLTLPEFKVLKYYGDIYTIEGSLADMSPEERLLQRKKQIQPLMKELHDYISRLDLTDPTISSHLKKAVEYTLKHWDGLTLFLKDGKVPIDNQFVENCIRPVARGRRRWLFANTPKGARASAIMYSIVETALHNGANPQIYMLYVLTVMSEHPEPQEEMMKDLTPYSDAYRSFEKEYMAEVADQFVPASQTKPYYRPWKKENKSSAG